MELIRRGWAGKTLTLKYKLDTFQCESVINPMLRGITNGFECTSIFQGENFAQMDDDQRRYTAGSSNHNSV